MQNLKVVIGIPTFKRPQGLQRLLESVSKQHTNYSLIVLVADNEGELGAGHQVVAKLKAGYPFELLIISVPERGISQVRNALLDYAFGFLAADKLAMIDDDEIVEPLWIEELVKMQLQENVDVVGGAVFPEFSETPPKWTEGLNLYWRPIHKAGRISLIQGTTSVLLNSTVRHKYIGMRFDPEFSMSGGGDKEFFTRLKLAGASFAFNPNAISYEYFESSRLTLTWAKQRAYRIGNGDVRIMRKHRLGVASWAIEIAKAISAVVVHSALYVIFFRYEDKKIHAMLKLTRQKGKLNGILGKPQDVYKNIHGA